MELVLMDAAPLMSSAWPLVVGFEVQKPEQP